MDCIGVIDFATEKPILFAPKMDPYYQIWMTIHTKETLHEKYGYEVRYLCDL
jgi:hypothetical protein